MARRLIRRLRGGRAIGKVVPVEEKLANALVNQGTHEFADDLDVRIPVAPPPPAREPKRTETLPRADRAKRQYKRRDMRPEP